LHLIGNNLVNSMRALVLLIRVFVLLILL